MQRKVGHALHDILQAIGRIESITHRKSLAEFEADWQLGYIVQRAIEIISEASRRIPADLQATRPEIPWRRVMAIGNVLRHEYQGLSDKVIWGVVIDELPKLKIAVAAISAMVKE
jgi:uncharacterized protein with HEPN domain